jgi:hypothetical protein
VKHLETIGRRSNLFFRFRIEFLSWKLSNRSVKKQSQRYIWMIELKWIVPRKKPCGTSTHAAWSIWKLERRAKFIIWIHHFRFKPRSFICGGV